MPSGVCVRTCDALMNGSGSLSQLTDNPLEVVVAAKVNYNLAGFILFQTDIDPCTQMLSQMILKREHVVGELWFGRTVFGLSRWQGCGPGLQDFPYNLFRSSNGDLFLFNPMGEFALLVLREWQDGFRMASRDSIGSEHGLYFSGKLQESHHIADSGSIQTQLFTKLFNGSAKSIQVVFKRLGLFQHVKILSLQVLFQRGF